MSCCNKPSVCNSLRFACNSAPRTGICGSDINPNYTIQTNRKPTLHEVIGMAMRTLQVPGGHVYFCDRSGHGTTVQAVGEDTFMVMPQRKTIGTGMLKQKLVSLLLAVNTDAVSMVWNDGSIVYNKAEISIMSTY